MPNAVNFCTIIVLSIASIAAAAEDELWSKVENDLQARLVFKTVKGANLTSTIQTYLELKNLSERRADLEVPLNRDTIEFELKDETGKIIESGLLDRIEKRSLQGNLSLPYDSVLRFNISHGGAGGAPGSAFLLDVGGWYAWSFLAGYPHSYTLSAKFSIKKGVNEVWRTWAGTIEIPPTPLPKFQR